MEVPDSLPPDPDLGDHREPEAIVNRLLDDVRALLNRYVGAIDQSQAIGVLEIAKHMECMSIWERSRDGQTE